MRNYVHNLFRHGGPVVFGLLLLLGGIVEPVNAAGYGVTVQGYNAQANLADATTYYYGCVNQGNSTTTARQRCYLPTAGTINDVNFFVQSLGQQATNETSTVSLRLNDTTDYTLSSTLDVSGNYTAVNASALGITVAAGDYVEFKWVTPTWATNPNGIRVSGQINVDTASDLPADAAGYLENDGAGALSWTTPTGGSLPAAAVGWLHNDGADNISWTSTVPSFAEDHKTLLAFTFCILLLLIIGLCRPSTR